MGICCRSKEIVYSNNISDIQFGSMERHEKNSNVLNNKINNLCKNIKQKTFDEKTSDILPKRHSIEEKEKKKFRAKLKFKNNSVKKVNIQSTNEFDSEFNENNNVHRRRGRSEHTSKFNRNQRKSVTLKHNNFLLSEKLRGVEMKIPVMQETFIAQKYGDPDKYYKKIKDLGS